MSGKILKGLVKVGLTLAISSIASSSAFGKKHPATEGGEGLEGSMKQMAFAIKAIEVTINDPSMNMINIQIADNFVQTATTARSLLPGEVRQLPEPDQSKRKALYEEMIDHAIELGEFLSTALKKNDQTKAQHFLEQIKVIENDGHKEFKENDLIVNVTLQATPQIQAASTLKAVMKIMGTNLKLIQAQLGDATQNQASSKLADEIVASAKDARAFIPASIDSLPTDQQAGRLDLYKQMIDKSIDMGSRLSQALSAGDEAAARTIINNLISNKKDGHFEFN